MNEKYPNGVSYHAVKISCDCADEEIYTVDEIGEDCEAYETAREAREKCETCGKNKIVRVIHTKDNPVATN